MAKVREPFNISILHLDKQQLRFLPKITSMSIRDPSTGNFHDDGFYSYTIFGSAGSEDRDRRFAVIECKVEILHPVIYDRLIRLKHLYGDIMSGKAYARWDPEQLDFVASDALTGQTGYGFFAQHVADIKFVSTGSAQRELRIKVVEENMFKAMTRHLLVLPAGLREIEVKEGGYESEQEITELYRRFLAISNTVPDGLKDYSDPVYDGQRWSLQRTFNDIYALLLDMFQGKKGIFQGKFGSRRVWNSTRNVISAINPTTEVLGSPNQPSCTAVQLGLYQMSKAALPVTQHALRTGILQEIFVRDVTEVELIDTETMERERVTLDPDTIDDFTTWDGIERLLNTLSDPGVRNEPIMVNGRYLCLVYVNNDSFRLFRGMSELPPEMMNKPGADVHPITYTELIYIAGYKYWNNLAAMVTRYPVSGMQSVIPLTCYARTTVAAKPKTELDSNWEPITDERFIAWEYPDWLPNASFVETTIVPAPYLAGLGGDFDGDTVSVNVLYSMEAIDEITNSHKKRAFWVSGKNKFNIDIGYDTVAFLLRNLTGPRGA
ncbi:hypothetical protein BZQ24_08735 [Salmonella enterica subsp. enterica serovar Enteritidis]|nr:hypothetical protein [Salmonella enterica subsp. enterica serovar Enteritidis]